MQSGLEPFHKQTIHPYINPTNVASSIIEAKIINVATMSKSNFVKIHPQMFEYSADKETPDDSNRAALVIVNNILPIPDTSFIFYHCGIVKIAYF